MYLREFVDSALCSREDVEAKLHAVLLAPLIALIEMHVMRFNECIDFLPVELCEGKFDVKARKRIIPRGVVVHSEQVRQQVVLADQLRVLQVLEVREPCLVVLGQQDQPVKHACSSCVDFVYSAFFNSEDFL